MANEGEGGPVPVASVHQPEASVHQAADCKSVTNGACALHTVPSVSHAASALMCFSHLSQSLHTLRRQAREWARGAWMATRRGEACAVGEGAYRQWEGRRRARRGRDV